MLTALIWIQLLFLLIHCWGPPTCTAGTTNIMSQYHKAKLNIMIQLAALLRSAITVCKITMVRTQPGRLLPTLRRKLLPLGSINTDTAIRKRLFHTPNILYTVPLIPIGPPRTLVPAIPCLASVPHFFLLSLIFYSEDEGSRIIQNIGNTQCRIHFQISRAHFCIANVNI
jgi:hypothetical protein